MFDAQILISEALSQTTAPLVKTCGALLPSAGRNGYNTIFPQVTVKLQNNLVTTLMPPVDR